MDQLTIALPRPWPDFLKEIDEALSRPTTLTCIGGFVLAALYGIPRPTGDIDYIEVMPPDAIHEIEGIGGPRSPLARKYRLALQPVGVADPPDEYATRLRELYLNLKKLKLQVLDPYDLLLSKLTRNSAKDREDAKYVIRRENLGFGTFYACWSKEMAPWIANRDRHE